MPDKPAKKKRPFRLSIANRTLTFTPLGTRFVIICVLVGFAAINTGSNLLYLCTSMMLSMMVVSGILSEQALKKVTVSRRLPDEMYAGSPFTVTYKAGNEKKRMPSFALTFSGYGKEGEAGPGAFVLRLPAGGDGSADTLETVSARGLWKTEGFEVSTRFPFGLFRKTRRIPRGQTGVVYPKVVRLPSRLPRELTSGYGETPSGKKGTGYEFLGIREYTESDEARLIHWKSSARLSRLMAKEFEAEQKRTVTVVLDDAYPTGAGEARDKLFEYAVSLAAAVARELLLEHGLPVAFVSRGFTAPAGMGRGQYYAIMDGLAFINPSDGAASGGYDAAERALADGPCVIVLPGRGAWWSRYAGSAAAVVEAGR